MEEEKRKLKFQNEELTPIISEQKADIHSEEIQALRDENTKLKQQSKSDQLKVGELQAQLAELRNQMSQIADGAIASENIKQLTEDNLNLQKQLDEMQTNTVSNVPPSNTTLDWRRMIIYLCIALVVGIATGVYLLDLVNRRRHGGFRV